MYKRILSVIVLLMMLLSLCSCYDENDEDKTEIGAVGSVNGIDITQDEINYYVKRLRSNVISKYVNDYGVEYSDDFWNHDVSGTTPEKYLSDSAFDECVMAKIQLIKCKEYGIYDDIDFSALKAKAERFNKDNEGKKTVGITSIDMDVFYTYYVETGALALKNKLIENNIINDESEYEQYIDSIVKSADIIKK